jgi:hypothetical protein
LTKTITKYDPDGRITYFGPDDYGQKHNPGPKVGEKFTISEASYPYVDARGNLRKGVRPMGCTMPEVRPGIGLKPASLPGRQW